MTTIAFRVYGEPAPKGSKRHVGGGRMIESSKKLPAWMQAATATARTVAPKTPLDCPVSVEATFWVPKPQKPRFNVPATPGDLDKYLRSIGDAIESAGLIRNDARITTWHARKRYADPNNPPGAHITITTHEPQETPCPGAPAADAPTPNNNQTH